MKVEMPSVCGIFASSSSLKRDIDFPTDKNLGQNVMVQKHFSCVNSVWIGPCSPTPISPTPVSPTLDQKVAFRLLIEKIIFGH